MTHEDQVFVANVVVTNTTWEIVVSNVISRPTSAIVEHSVIVKIHEYRGVHERHHFILMAMEVHDTSGVILIISLRSVPIFFTIDNQKDIYPRLFAFNFSSNVLVLFFIMF
jgi:hypothetical protein